MALELKLGDVIRLKKAHPCGNHLWQVTRLGADIGLTFEKCRRHVMVSRSKLGRRIKEILPASISAPGTVE